MNWKRRRRWNSSTTMACDDWHWLIQCISSQSNHKTPIKILHECIVEVKKCKKKVWKKKRNSLSINAFKRKETNNENIHKILKYPHKEENQTLKHKNNT